MTTLRSRFILALVLALIPLAGCEDGTGNTNTSNGSCTADGDCTNGFCDTASSTCQDAVALGEACERDAQCAEGTCISSVCAVETTDTPCTTRSDCDAPYACIDGLCAAGGDSGSTCSADDDCAQPLVCTDGACLTDGVDPDDQDSDGYTSVAAGGTDCDDNNAGINPGATEVCGDNIDQDCVDGDLSCDEDADNDGFKGEAFGGPDCDDGNAAINPDAFDICLDGIDQNCNDVDDPCDLDRDGYGDVATGGDDCDDDNPDIFPGAFDVCEDGVDQDCMGGDPVCVDADEDGFPDRDQGGNDCDDDDPDISPAAEERCGDGIDQDCDGTDNTCPVEACEFIPPTSTFDASLEWEFFGAGAGQNVADEVHCTATPIVIPLTDDNGNGVVDDDDIPTVVFNAWRSNQRIDSILRALRGDTGEEIWNTRATGVFTDGSSNPAAGDLDLDGWPEIAARHEDGHLVVFDHDGTFLWEQTNAGARQASAPVIADLDNDKRPEVIFGKHVVSHTGELLATGSESSTGENAVGSMPCVADLDGNNTLEVITGNVAYAYDPSGPALDLFWPDNAERTNLGDGYCAIGDMDTDGDPDVILIRLGVVSIIDGPTGAVLGSVDVAAATTSDNSQDNSQGRCGAPTIGDFDSDGKPEIGMACKWSYALFDAVPQGDGSIEMPLVWERTTEDNSSHRTGSSVFDFEADGQAEVVYNDEEYLRVYDGKTGDVRFEVPNSSRTQSENPVIVDVDNDGNAEIVVCASNDSAFPHDPGIPTRHGITVWGDANDFWVPTRKIWNQHTYSITNVNDDASIPDIVTPNWSLFNNYRANAQGDGVFDAPDLIVELVDYQARSCPVSFTIGVRITNDGQLRVGPGIPFRVVVTDSNGDVRYDAIHVTTRGLPPGASQRLDITVDGPFSSELLDIEATVDVNAEGKSTANECREDNNTASATGFTCNILN